MKFLNLLAISSLLALTSLQAQATTIDFEASGTPGTYNALDYPIDGFIFSHTMDNIDVGPAGSWSGTGPAHSGTFAALNNYGGAGVITLAAGGTFSFENLWLKSWFGSASTMTVTGSLNGVDVGSVSGTVNMEWVNFVGNFSAIDTLTITPTTGGNFLVDDIALNSMDPVPEPESYAMLLAGLGLLGCMAKRRRKA